jgi:hypothetical protein
MKMRLASLFLLLVLFGGALAGAPLSYGESNCSMDGRVDMDCCKHALLQQEQTKVSEAELLCALNCSQNGTTAPAGVVRVTPPAQDLQSSHPSLTYVPSLPISVSRVVSSHTHGPPGSPPTYLLNLALLI